MKDLLLSNLIGTTKNILRIGKGKLDLSGLTENRVYTGPDKSGTIILLNDLPNKNWIINPNFNIWQRGTTQTGNGYGSVDAYYFSSVGTTKSISRQSFTLGQTDIPGNPKYFLRIAVTSVAGASNNCIFDHRIAGVANLSGGNIRLSFLARADANKNIGISLDQNFGTTGSPSSGIAGNGSLLALTTAWAKKTLTIPVPSISGKTLGTDSNDFTRLIFWLDSGSSTAARSGNLGQQSGTFDIARLKVEIGEIETDEDMTDDEDDLDDCQVRYWQGVPGSRLNGPSYVSGCVLSAPVHWPVQMRAVPTLGSSLAGLGYVGCSGFNFNTPSLIGARMYVTSNTVSPNCYISFGANDYLSASADL